MSEAACRQRVVDLLLTAGDVFDEACDVGVNNLYDLTTQRDAVRKAPFVVLDAASGVRADTSFSCWRPVWTIPLTLLTRYDHDGRPESWGEFEPVRQRVIDLLLTHQHALGLEALRSTSPIMLYDPTGGDPDAPRRRAKPEFVYQDFEIEIVDGCP